MIVESHVVKYWRFGLVSPKRGAVLCVLGMRLNNQLCLPSHSLTCTCIRGCHHYIMPLAKSCCSLDAWIVTHFGVFLLPSASDSDVLSRHWHWRYRFLAFRIDAQVFNVSAVSCQRNFLTSRTDDPGRWPGWPKSPGRPEFASCLTPSATSHFESDVVWNLNQTSRCFPKLNQYWRSFPKLNHELLYQLFRG